MKQYLFIAIFVISFLMYGCSSEAKKEKIEDLDFTVVEENEIPEELKTVIEEKKEAKFHMSYSNKDKLYIIVGYGEQATSGYSIEVPTLYRTEASIVIDTNLIGPTGEALAKKSYPYIVIMTQYRDLPVEFQ